MAGRSSRRLWRLVAVGSCLLWAIAELAGATAVGHPTRPVSGTARSSVRMLQLNLCDSGIAGCYTGRSVREASELIHAERPDIVTLNEVCRDDVSVLGRALADTGQAGGVAVAFEAAVDRRTAEAFRCRNGQPYGIGIVARVRPSDPRFDRTSAVYPIQDTSDPEERVWLCLHAATGFYACTTHLANTSATVALVQCRYLLDTAIPAERTRGRLDPMVLGGDLNLRSGGSPDARSCLPHGYVHADDGALQHVVASTGVTVRSSRVISMHGATDHPALLVDLSIPRGT
jgi:endonuclease/exonuclease/phosphatase (EEP) superfamily protein YafD